MPESPMLRKEPVLEAAPPRGCETVVSSGALAFIAKLETTFSDRRRALLVDRVTRQK
jgi:malate synthase